MQFRNIENGFFFREKDWATISYDPSDDLQQQRFQGPHAVLLLPIRRSQGQVIVLHQGIFNSKDSIDPIMSSFRS